MGVESIRLEDSPAETWANTILYRLAIALGVAEAGDGTIQVDPDDILEAAEEHIRAWADDECFTDVRTYADLVDQVVYTGRIPYGLSTEHEAVE